MMNTAQSFSGSVIKGEKLSYMTGYPTANLSPDTIKDLGLREGVYACWTQIEGDTARHHSALIIGAPAQNGGTELKVEVHLLGFEGDLYGKMLVVDVVHRIRDLVPADDLNALKRQIEEDLAHIRHLLHTE